MWQCQSSQFISQLQSLFPAHNPKRLIVLIVIFLNSAKALFFREHSREHVFRENCVATHIFIRVVLEPITLYVYDGSMDLIGWEKVWFFLLRCLGWLIWLWKFGKIVFALEIGKLKFFLFSSTWHWVLHFLQKLQLDFILDSWDDLSAKSKKVIWSRRSQ